MNNTLETQIDLVAGIDELCKRINADFVKFMTSSAKTSGRKSWPTREGYITERINEFSNQLQYSVGKKYIKITSGRSVWGFVVIEDSNRRVTGDLFSAGDILKPAGANAPARNFARGNVLKNDFSRVQWAGAS